MSLSSLRLGVSWSEALHCIACRESTGGMKSHKKRSVTGQLYAVKVEVGGSNSETDFSPNPPFLVLPSSKVFVRLFSSTVPVTDLYTRLSKSSYCFQLPKCGGLISTGPKSEPPCSSHCHNTLSVLSTTAILIF